MNKGPVKAVDASLSRKQQFVRQLAVLLVENQALRSIALEMDQSYARDWAALRFTTPIAGYPTVDEAEKTLGAWLGIPVATPIPSPAPRKRALKAAGRGRR